MKDILDYVKQQQKLDREERAECRKIRMALLQAEDKKRADEIRIAQIQAAKYQAKIEADKELTLKELKLRHSRIKPVPALRPLHPLVIMMPSPRSYHLL